MGIPLPRALSLGLGGLLAGGAIAGCALSPGSLGPLPRFSIQAEYVAAGVPGDSSNDWDLRMIGVAPDPIPALGGAAEVVVAVVDTGVDPAQPALVDRLLPMVDLVGDDVYNGPGGGANYRGRDGNGHGTHVAGIVEATIGANNPIALLPVKAIGHSGVGDDGTIAQGIHRAVDWRDPADPARRVRVINLSVGGKLSSKILEDALAYAISHDVLVVVAAGNRERDVDYPAALPSAFAVSATTLKDGLASYSNRGNSVGISAPGGDNDAAVVSTWPTYLTAGDLSRGTTTPHLTSSMVGTSMATPHVTGAAALVFAEDPSLTAMQARVRLEASATGLGPVGPNGYFGVGRLQVDAALARGAHDAH
jgi:subtilisin family serine protease